MNLRAQHLGRRAWLLACLLALEGGKLASAAAYPDRPIKLVIPYAAGGPTDVLGRLVGQKLAERLKQAVVIENRPGSGAAVGFAAVAKAVPDGYTLLLGDINLAVNPFLYKSLPYDAQKELAPIGLVASAPLVMLVSQNSPARSLQDLMGLAKADPGKLTFGSAGAGNTTHLSMELFKAKMGLDIVHVPYKGAAAAATDVIAGLCTMTFGSFPGVMPFVKSGQLRVIAAATEQRTSLAPDMPTLAESVPGLHANAWYGLFAPAGTPKEIVTRLNQEITKLLQQPEIKERFNALGAEVTPSTPEQLAALVKSDLTRWAKIVKDSGAQLD